MGNSDWTRRGVLAGSAAAGAAAVSGMWPGVRRARAQSSGRKPNVIFIMADDMGYADLGCFGARDYDTRNIDRMAAQGMRLTHAYANSSVCSPTRVGLITGRYQYRLRVGLDEPGGINAALSPEHPTLASLFKEQGYRTMLVGKWHLGRQPETSPIRCGYDHFFGLFGGGVDYFSHSFRGEHDLNEDEVPVEKIGYLTDLLGDRAVTEIEKAAAADEPLMMSLHFTAPHWPWEGPEDEAVSRRIDNIQHYDGGSLETYAKMMKSLDDNVGKVLAALEKGGMADDTIVVFTSDNGGERFSDVWPFIGMKAELLEGGIRVPTIVRWPGQIAAGSESAQVNMSMDWLPTLLAAAGGAPDPEYPSDGMNLLDVYRGAQPEVERSMFWRFKAHDQHAVRAGRWKYLKMDDNEWLFDIVTDARERADRKAHEPERFERLKAEWAAWNETMLPYTEETTTFSQKGWAADRY